MSWPTSWEPVAAALKGRKFTLTVIDDPVRQSDAKVPDLRQAAQEPERARREVSYYVRRNYPNLARELRFIADPPRQYDAKDVTITIAGHTLNTEDFAQFERIIYPENPMPTKPKKIKASTEDLLVKLLAAIKATYPNDVPSAGLVLSELGGTGSLPEPRRQYGSICRYGGGKTVVHQAYGVTLKDVLVELSQKLVGQSAARDALARLVK